MSTTELDRSMLEGKDREELHAIAGAVGVKAPTRMRKADLVTAILEATVGTAGDSGEAAGTGQDPDTHGALGPGVGGRDRVHRGPRRRGGHDRGHRCARARDRSATRRSFAPARPSRPTKAPTRPPPTPPRPATARGPSIRTGRARRATRPRGGAHPAGGRRRRPRGRAVRARRRRSQHVRRRQLPPASARAGPQPAPAPRVRSAPAWSRRASPIEVRGLLELPRRGLRVPAHDRLPSRARATCTSRRPQVRRFTLRKGDFVEGSSRPQASNEKYPAPRRRHRERPLHQRRASGPGSRTSPRCSPTRSCASSSSTTRSTSPAASSTCSRRSGRASAG